MAEIVQESPEWSAVIRCAEPVHYPKSRVDGCFSLIKISLDDIVIKDNGSDYQWYEVQCPACGQILRPAWQLGDGPMNTKLARQRSRS